MVLRKSCKMFILMFCCLFGDVIGDKNIALRKDTRQISEYQLDSVAHGSHLAVNGNITQNAARGGCSHTKSIHDYFWWTVDLGDTYFIDHVVIYGRSDCCANRLSNFDILLYDPTNVSWDNYDIEQGKLCCRQPVASPIILNARCTNGMKGRYVKILKKRNYDIVGDCLTLCEVQVFEKKSEKNENVSTELDILDNNKERSCDGSYIENPISTTHSEPMCPCSCSYQHRLDNSTNTDIPNHTRDEWLQILIPVLEQLDKELRINKTKLSATRRKRESANDNRKSAQRLGIVGAVFLAVVIGLIIFIDIASIWTGYERNKHIPPRYP